MGLRIEKKAAEQAFAVAVARARGSILLPEEWMERARRVSGSKSMTFTPMLGTALLAKATDRRVDTLSLRSDAGHKSYSARGLAKSVFVPCCVQEGIDIRNTGAEPLNNQPFLRASRVDLNLNVKSEVKPELEYLIECLTAADFLEGEAALDAFAAFLRVRLEASEVSANLDLARFSGDVQSARLLAETLMQGDSEGGKTGQALTAAILDMSGETVKTKRINDPSAKWPGDVGVFRGGQLVFAAEVKQRPFSPTEILLFAKRLSDASVHRGLVVALDQASQVLPVEELRQLSLGHHAVVLRIITDPLELMELVLLFSWPPPREIAEKFPGCLAARLAELEVSQRRLDEYARALEAAESTDAN